MFHFDLNRKIMYIFMALLIAIGVASFISKPSDFLDLVLTIPAVLIAITFHEFAHAFVADKLGDDTARRQGRLTLNPLAHLDPIGSVLLIVAGFGWGKPVEINPRNFNRNISMSAGNALVSVAGPIMNFLLALIFAIIYMTILKFAPAFVSTQAGTITMIVVEITITINIGLGVFNLIPLPPLDGSKILMHFLPYNAREWFEKYSQMFYILFLILWWTHITDYIITPVIFGVRTGLFNIVKILFGM